MKVTPKIMRSGGDGTILDGKKYLFLDDSQTIDVPDSLGEDLIVNGLYLPEGIGAKKSSKPLVDLTPAIPDDGVIGKNAGEEGNDDAAGGPENDERAELAAEYEAIFNKAPHPSMSTDNLRKKIEKAKAEANQ